MKMKPDYSYRTQPILRRLIRRLINRPMATKRREASHAL